MSDSSNAKLQLALAKWNDFRKSIDQAPIHRLSPENSKKLRDLLDEHGFAAWCLVVDLFAARHRRALDEEDNPRPAYLGIALNEAAEVLNRAREDGTYPLPITDDEAMLT